MDRSSIAYRRAQFRKYFALIIFAAAVVYLAGNSSVSLWDRDEPRYAQTSRQMLQSGDWIVPRFLDQVRTAKPPLVYWCQAISMKLFSDATFAARFPSTVAMLLTLLALGALLPRAIGRRRTGWAMLILATSGLAIASAKMCLTDSLLLVWTTVAQICFYLVLRGRARWLTWVVMGIAIGLAVLTKGPVVFGVMAMTAIVLLVMRWRDRISFFAKPRAMAAGTIACVALACVIVAPWLIAIERHSPGFLATALRHDVLQRAQSGLEGHSGPPGYYLLTIWATYFPWSIFLPGAIWFGWKNRADPLIRFCFAAIVGPWLMFEVVQTKLPHYLLPVFPPLAILTARMLVRASRKRLPRSARIVAFIWSLVVLLIALIPFATSFLLPLGSIAQFVSILILAIGFGVARQVFVEFRRGRLLRGAAAMGIGTMILVPLLYAGWIGQLPEFQTSRRIASILRESGATNPIMIDYKEPSLAFYEGGTIREQSNNRFLIETDPSQWPAWIVMTQRIWEALPQILRDQLQPVGEVHGMWYANRGKSADVVVVRKK